jgi:hypothetical protein
MPFGITRKILYKTIYLESLSKNEITRYKQGIDYIVLYSENCAKALLILFNVFIFLPDLTFIQSDYKSLRLA